MADLAVLPDHPDAADDPERLLEVEPAFPVQRRMDVELPDGWWGAWDGGRRDGTKAAHLAHLLLLAPQDAGVRIWGVRAAVAHPGAVACHWAAALAQHRRAAGRSAA